VLWSHEDLDSYQRIAELNIPHATEFAEGGNDGCIDVSGNAGDLRAIRPAEIQNQPPCHHNPLVEFLTTFSDGLSEFEGLKTTPAGCATPCSLLSRYPEE
jgi:hypothetical protein